MIAYLIILYQLFEKKIAGIVATLYQLFKKKIARMVATFYSWELKSLSPWSV